MPKKSKTESSNAVPADDATAITSTAPAAKSAATKKPKGTKKAASRTSAAKKKSPAARKSAPKRKPAPPAESTEPSDADIRLRAYFIAERRVQLALTGDPARDWIEAREQLVAEARQARS